MGYHRAGFEVVGVDIEAQPNYPFEFHQADALAFPLEGFDAIHASPPCQAFTAYRRNGKVGDHHLDLVDPTRQVLVGSGVPWVMENVVGAPLLNPVMICGTMFDPPMEIQRHRLFESNWGLTPPTWPCRHKLNGPDRYPGGSVYRRKGKRRSEAMIRRTVEVGSWSIPLAKQCEVMGVDWMTLPELSNAIPPAYTEHIGRQLIGALVAG